MLVHVPTGARRPFGSPGRTLCRLGLGSGLLVLMGLIGSAGHARQQIASSVAAPPADPAAKDTPKAEDKKPAKAEEKRYAFSMDGKPWKEVFTWLANNTGKEVIGNKPTGTFTFISPVKRTYTMPEVIDILNETLLANSQTQKYYMINRERNFTLVPADEKIDGHLLPRIRPDELADRGRTELVQMILTLKTLNVTDMTTEIKKMMGPFGEVTALEKSNQLLLQDTVANLSRIKKTLDDIEKTESRQANQLSYKCKYIKATDAERVLRELLLGEAKPSAAASKGGPTPAPAPAAPAQPAGKKPTFITSNERAQAVLVVGPADRVAEAKSILERIDQPDGDAKPVLVGASQLKSYSVPTGTAEAVVKTLRDAFKDSPTFRIETAGSKILVYATPEDQITIAKLILGGTGEKGAALKTETIPTGDRDPADLAKTIAGMLGEVKSGAPYVEAVPDKNAILVRGSEDQIAEVKLIVQATTGDAPGSSSRMRIVNLDSGNATLLAEELARVLGKMRKNPVDLVAPDRREKKAPMPKAKGEEKLKTVPKTDGDVRAPAADGKVRPVSFQGDGGLVDPRETKKPAKDDRPGSADKPVRIFASGNRLLIASDDPDALALVSQLVKLYTAKTAAGKGDFQILKLQNANATDVAKALDEAFNGPKQPATPQMGGGRFGMFGGGGAPAAPVNPDANRIRVVAYPATNSLLVRASPIDMLSIRDLLFNALDPEETDPRGQVRTYRIKVKYGSATEIASWLKDVYKEQIAAPAATGGGFFARMQAAQDQSTRKPAALSVGVDERTNSLIVATSEGLYKDIQKMVDEIDQAAQSSTRTVKVVSIKGIDPNVVQQAIDAIQGKAVRRASGSSSFGGNSFAPSPYSNAPGFLPGGGFSPVIVAPNTGGTLRSGGAPLGGSTGGGGRQGGGGGGGGNRGPKGSSDARQPGSDGRSDFFAQRVKDDPPQSGLFDPHPDTTDVVHAIHTGTPGQTAGSPALPSTIISDSILATSYQDKDPKGPKDPKGTPIEFGGTAIEAPRSNVNVESLPELGVVVISGNNAADVEAVIKIIDELKKIGVAGDLQVKLVPVLHGDASLISSYLTEFYRRVIVGPSGTTRQTQSIRSGPQGQVVEQLSSVVLLPYPRFNSILVAAPRARLEEVVKQIGELDKPTPEISKLTAFPLKRASAVRVATLINSIYASRFTNETAQITGVRVSYDEGSNTVFIQAPPADLENISDLIKRIDESVSAAVYDLRIVPVRFGLADEIAAIIQRAITQGVQQSTVGGGQGIVPNVGGQQNTRQPGAPGLATQTSAQAGGFPGGGGGFPGGGGGFPGGGAAGGFPGGAGAGGGAGVSSATGSYLKYTSLRFISAMKDGKTVESGYLDDIRLIGDIRTNNIIVSAPAKAMDLIVTLIQELDTLPRARAEINIFPLKKADAAQTAATLQQLFLGTGSGPQTGQAGGGTGGAPGAPGGGLGGGGGGIPGLGGAGAFPGTTSLLGGGGLRPLALTLGGVSPDGIPLIDLRLTVDVRTNSLIVAGSRNDLDIIEALVTRLDDADVQTRRSDVYALRNTTAVDVASALNTFIQQSLTVYRNSAQLTLFQDLEREVVVVPEPITNKLLISATPRYYPDIMRLVAELDAELPQVVIQVLIAEVDLTNTDEFGVEIGLQSPVLFQRGIFPATGLLGSGTVSYTNPSTTTIGPQAYTGPGVTVNSTINPTSALNYNFNNPGVGLTQNVAVSPGVVGYQGLTNLGTGRVSPNNGVGGFVFSAGSDAFNLLVRALRSQGRIDILSRPQVTTLDNQAAQVAVGQSVPYIQGSNLTGTGVVSTSVLYRDVGVILNVVPKISPDGHVTMRVSPSVSSVSPTLLSLGNGIQSPVFNQQVIDTTVIARDGETVVIGGLITRSDAKSENKVPWLGDLPYLGTLFRYRQQVKRKQELLVIMTPHVVRNRFEAERILAMEGRRMDWILGDVVKTQGASGMLPLFPAPPVGAVPPASAPGGVDGAIPGPLLPGVPGPSVVPITPAMPEPILPVPRPADLPAPMPDGPPAATVPAEKRPLAGLSTLKPTGTVTVTPAEPAAPAPAEPAPAANDGKESDKWRLFRRSP